MRSKEIRSVAEAGSGATPWARTAFTDPPETKADLESRSDLHRITKLVHDPAAEAWRKVPHPLTEHDAPKQGWPVDAKKNESKSG